MYETKTMEKNVNAVDIKKNTCRQNGGSVKTLPKNAAIPFT